MAGDAVAVPRAARPACTRHSLCSDLGHQASRPVLEARSSKDCCTLLTPFQGGCPSIDSRSLQIAVSPGTMRRHDKYRPATTRPKQRLLPITAATSLQAAVQKGRKERGLGQGIASAQSSSSTCLSYKTPKTTFPRTYEKRVRTRQVLRRVPLRLAIELSNLSQVLFEASPTLPNLDTPRAQA